MRRMVMAASGVGMMVMGMVLAGAATEPAGTGAATAPARRARAAGASTQASDGNIRAHPAWARGCERRVEAMQGKPVDIVFVGDSITDNFLGKPSPTWDEVGGAVWDKHYAGRNVLNFGVGADRTEHVLWRLEHWDVKAFRPKVAVVLIGTNNTNDTPEEIAAGVKAVVEKTREVFGGPKVILVSILPNKRAGALMAAANELIEKIADGKDVVWFDLASKMPAEGDGWKGIGKDKLHLSPEGYEIWASEMEPVLDQLMKG
jgi:lysophospholipase L1-like esterase